MITFDVDDTIVAIASPPGGSLRGIIRVSGPRAMACLRPLCFDDNNQPVLSKEIQWRTALPCVLAINEQTQLPGRLLVWPDQRSYTQQPSIEFHTIGSPPILEMATAAICRAGARLAERGEFTLRAFLSGRIDLTQAEAVLAVIDSENQMQLDNALIQLSGGLAGPLTRIRETLIEVLAELEAGLDFVEEDIEFISSAELARRLQEGRQLLSDLNKQIRSRHLNRPTFGVALIGHPNAGKSSLFNVLLDQERAIVANAKGTTRDFVTATVTWEDLEICLTDTAGIELRQDEKSANSEIENRAQHLTYQQWEQADLIVGCVPANGSASELETIIRQSGSQPRKSVVVAITKSDLIPPPQIRELEQKIQSRWAGEESRSLIVTTSSHDRVGIQELKSAIAKLAIQQQNSSSSFVNSTATRAAANLEAAEDAITMALQAVEAEAGLEIVAAELRRTLHELGTVVGTVYTDDILDRIFSRFCIGK